MNKHYQNLNLAWLLSFKKKWEWTVCVPELVNIEHEKTLSKSEFVFIDIFLVFPVFQGFFYHMNMEKNSN